MHWFINALGIIGNVLFGVGVVPPAYRALRAGNTLFPVDTAWIIGGACLTFYTYLTATYGTSWMTTPIGVIETGAYAILLRYHYFPRAVKAKEIVVDWNPMKEFEDHDLRKVKPFKFDDNEHAERMHMLGLDRD